MQPMHHSTSTFISSTYLVRSRGLVVKADDSQSRGCGFEPRRRILDGMQAKLAIALKIKRNKGSQMGHTKKKKKKKKKKSCTYFFLKKGRGQGVP